MTGQELLDIVNHACIQSGMVGGLKWETLTAQLVTYYENFAKLLNETPSNATLEGISKLSRTEQQAIYNWLYHHADCRIYTR